MARLGTVIEQARRRAFVGRSAELSCFDSLLERADPRRIMFVHGPGGIGKSALLDELAARARAAGRVAALVDLREVDWSPDGLRAALDWASARAGSDPSVVLLDGYERFSGNDAWMRNEFLPSLAESTVVVLAGQDPPSAPWITDGAWRTLVSVHRLGVLGVADSRELLDRAGVADDVAARLAALARGHPLTLALLAEAVSSGATAPDALGDAPDLVAVLIERIVGDVPGADHLTGLGVCAHAWLTTEDLLRRAVGEAAPAVWTWLESRPFVTRTPNGLTPHELVREALEADLLRRSTEDYLRVHRIVHEHVVASMRRVDAYDRLLWVHQKLWLHRHSPLSALYLMIRDHGPTTLVAADAGDHGAVLDLVERSEGPAGAALVARWLAVAPDNLQVIRADDGLAAFTYNLVLSPDELRDAERRLGVDDPVVRAVDEFAARTAPARPGEQLWIGRFIGGPRGYQRDPYAVAVAAMAATVEWVTRPLAWSFAATVDPEFWGGAFDYLAFGELMVVAGDGVGTTVYANDWRRLPVDAWLELLNERELSSGTGPAPAAMLRPAPMSRERFDDAVKQALRDLRRPDRLRSSALMGSTLAFDGRVADAERLRAMLDDAIDRLGREPRGEALSRVLDGTYRHGAPSQEAAAEVLDLPFSTYRRHLARALARLSDVLWALEIGAVRPEELTSP